MGVGMTDISGEPNRTHRGSTDRPDEKISKHGLSPWNHCILGRGRPMKSQEDPRRSPMEVLGQMPSSRIDNDMATQRTDDIELLTTAQVSELTGVPVSTLKRWRGEHSELGFVKLGRAVRYRLSDLRTWLDEHTTDAER